MGAFDSYFTVQIPPYHKDDEKVTDQNLFDVQTILKNTNYITEVEAYSKEEIMKMFEQTIQTVDLDKYDLPHLFNVKITNRQDFRFDLLKQDLQAIVQNITILSDQELLIPYVKLAEFMVTFSYLFCFILMIWFLSHMIHLAKERSLKHEAYWSSLFQMGMPHKTIYTIYIRPIMRVYFFSTLIAGFGFFLLHSLYGHHLTLLFPNIMSTELLASLVGTYILSLCISLFVFTLYSYKLFKSHLMKSYTTDEVFIA